MSQYEIACPQCLTQNSGSRLFCGRCKTILDPRTNLSLRIEDFQCSTDKEALEILKSTGILAYLVDQFLVKPSEQKKREWLSKHGVQTSLGDLDPLVQECAYSLSLTTLPEVYVIKCTGYPNAFTFGDDNTPIIVIDSRLVRTMTQNQLRALLGHEMGHIKSKHLLYHNLANTLAEGIGMSISFFTSNMITTATRLALLAWHRESEFTADRAALISSANPEHVASMFAKLSGQRPSESGVSDGASLLSGVARAFQSHPNHLDRAKAVFHFSKSREYATIVEKISYRRIFRSAFSPNCRFCKAGKSVNSLFCPECGRSQI